jgi:hypothetical protein
MYGAVTRARYRIDSRDSLSMEMPDGSTQRTVTVKSAFLTWSARGAANQLVLDVVLDSLMLDRPNAMLQPLIDSAQGTRWSGVIRQNGHIDSLVPNKPSVFGEQVRGMLTRLFPTLPDGGAEPGREWQDNSTIPYQIMAGFSASEERAAQYRAGKWEDIGGIRSLAIQSAIQYSVSGSGSGYGQEIKVDGGGEAQGTHHLSAEGHLLRAQVSDSVKLRLNIPAIGQTVPTSVHTVYSLATIP